MDDKTKTGTPDSKLINMNEEYEVQYWTETFRVSKEQLQEAVNAVGTSAQAVKVYLQQ